MANKKVVTVNGTQMAMAPREEDLTDLEKLLSDLQGEVDKARDEGRIFMMQEYVRLVALVSPEIDRIQRRFKRESLASSRKEHADMKAAARAALLAERRPQRRRRRSRSQSRNAS